MGQTVVNVAVGEFVVVVCVIAAAVSVLVWFAVIVD